MCLESCLLWKWNLPLDDLNRIMYKVLSHLISEANAFQDIISTYYARKSVYERLIKMLRHQNVVASPTQHVVPSFEKDIAHVDEVSRSSWKEYNDDLDEVASNSDYVALNSDYVASSLWFSLLFCWLTVFLKNWTVYFGWIWYACFDDVILTISCHCLLWAKYGEKSTHLYFWHTHGYDFEAILKSSQCCLKIGKREFAITVDWNISVGNLFSNLLWDTMSLVVTGVYNSECYIITLPFIRRFVLSLIQSEVCKSCVWKNIFDPNQLKRFY